MLHTILIDSHLHIYPCFDLYNSFRNLVSNLVEIGNHNFKSSSKITYCALLTERFDCNLFTQLSQNSSLFSVADIQVLCTQEKGVLLVKVGAVDLFLFAGRQIVSKEKIEVLALAEYLEAGQISDKEFPLHELIKRIAQAGAIPAINWAPGKWFFERGRIVEKLIKQTDPSKVLLCDTTLRPNIWLKPRIMRQAEEKRFKVMAGSDALPNSGEEKYVGSYCSALNTDLDLSKPGLSLKTILCNPQIEVKTYGKRRGVFDAGWKVAKQIVSNYTNHGSRFPE